MTATVWDHIRVEPKIERGQYVIAGERFTRATTFASTIEDRFNLEKWFKRMTALGLVARPDLLTQIAAHHDDDKRKLDAFCEEAIEAAKGSTGANLGTALHRLAERVDLGESPTIPAPYDADIAAYTAKLREAGVRILPELMEGVVVVRSLKVAGRFDRVVEIDGYDLPLIADLKTGSIDFSIPTIATQLALYANADELYDPATDTCSPMVEVDTKRALIIHLPAGQARCELVLVDIEQGWKAAQMCAAVRGWRQNRTLSQPFVTPDRRTFLAGRVENLRDRYPDALADLAAMWPDGVPTFKSGLPLSDEHLDSIALVVSTVEAKHQVAFGDSDPADRRPDTETLAALDARLAALPTDLLEAVNESARRLDLPNVRSRQFRQRHIADAEALIVDAEQAAARRWDDAQITLDEVCAGDLSLHPAVHAACGSDGSAWTAQQLEVLVAIRTAARTNTLVWADGVLCSPDADGHLVDWYGNRREALAAVKTLADAFGLSRPKSVAEAAANPTLVALAMRAAS